MKTKCVSMRRDPLQIIKKVFECLEKERGALSINQIAKITGLHNITVRRYVRLIEMIKNESGLEVIKTRHSIILRIEKNKE